MGFLTGLFKKGAELLIGAGINKAIGSIEKGAEDARQLEQQRKLQELAIKGSKEMGEFNTRQQLDIWNATNYSAQKEQLKKAGLNPALMYANGGGGGTTGSSGMGINSATAANAAQTQSASNEQALITAQIANINANTEKTKSETENAPKQGELIDQNITNLKEQLNEIKSNVKNKDAQTAAINIENNINQVKERIMTDPLNFSQIQDGMLANYNKTYHEATILFNEGVIKQETQQTVIKMIQKEYELMGVQKLLMESNKNLNEQQVKYLAATIQYQTDLIEQNRLVS